MISKNTQIKSIIPELISLDTDLNHIKGFYLSEDFSFYKRFKQELFHYKIVIDNKFAVPQIYDFRNGYFTKIDSDWYYYRKIFFFELKFKYNLVDKIFYFNSTFLKIPFEIGGILPVGKLIADIINLELFNESYLLSYGCAVNINNKNICILGLGFNGKTSLVNKVIKNGGNYISEDIVIINFNTNTVYPTPIWYKLNNFARATNRDLKEDMTNDHIIKESKKIDKIILLQNSTNPEYNRFLNKTKSFHDYILVCSMLFLKNTLTRSIILEDNLSGKIWNELIKLKEIGVVYQFINIKNFNFDQIIK